jgi:hypothetical protein
VFGVGDVDEELVVCKVDDVVMALEVLEREEVVSEEEELAVDIAEEEVEVTTELCEDDEITVEEFVVVVVPRDVA